MLGRLVLRGQRRGFLRDLVEPGVNALGFLSVAEPLAGLVGAGEEARAERDQLRIRRVACESIPFCLCLSDFLFRHIATYLLDASAKCRCRRQNRHPLFFRRALCRQRLLVSRHRRSRRVRQRTVSAAGFRIDRSEDFRGDGLRQSASASASRSAGRAGRFGSRTPRREPVGFGDPLAARRRAPPAWPLPPDRCDCTIARACLATALFFARAGDRFERLPRVAVGVC